MSAGGSFELNPNDRGRLCCCNPGCTSPSIIMDVPGRAIGTCFTRLGDQPCTVKLYTCAACGMRHVVEFCAGSCCDDVVAWGPPADFLVVTKYNRT